MKNYKNKNPLYKNVAANYMLHESERTYNYGGNRCLYCYDNVPGRDTFHAACSRKFFGQAIVPVFDYDSETLKEVALQYVKQSMAVTGVQPKVSLSWYRKQDKNVVKKLTIVGLYGEYILKPQSDYYAQLPELEDSTMHMATVCGLKTVPHTLFYLTDNMLCYLTKRVDRTKTDRLHMEDMCQLTERLTEDKYKGSHEQVAKTILKYSATPMLDVANFFEYVLFSYLTGNADMHLKNFSLLETKEKGHYTLAPAYDMLNTVLVNPNDKEELALTLNGKKSNLNYTDFATAYHTSGLTKKVLDTALENFYYCRYEMEDVLHKSFLTESFKLAYATLLQQRLNKLLGSKK
jgi:serine/threonine-protein kinase HipA